MEKLYNKILLLAGCVLLSSHLHSLVAASTPQTKEMNKKQVASVKKSEHYLAKRSNLNKAIQQVMIKVGSLVIIAIVWLLFYTSLKKRLPMDKAIAGEIKKINKIVAKALKGDEDSFLGYFSRLSVGHLEKKFTGIRKDLESQLETMGIKKELQSKIEEISLTEGDEYRKSPYVAALRLLLYKKVKETAISLQKKGENFANSVLTNISEDASYQIDHIMDKHTNVPYIKDGKVDKELFISDLKKGYNDEGK